ncbi:glycoside hydrolase family 130 protein [Parapedobacter koreensis]|uniref:Predicted glycosyl hydrolase, GH43/DUF377 family n=1 Tax=Parapedobacter koreensis TaxID=332977 RepID=A0A1H7MZ22_9SPHI|nr:hypothetical protein [Parapedobacter koreensis]SEL16309.1 Predicted glycosyl hydrolase, GH43/DUF377 family [Parapedobacter koreensis]
MDNFAAIKTLFEDTSRLVDVKKEGILLESTILGFESLGVFNPAAIRVGSDVHLFYRAVREGNFSTIGYCRLDGPLQIAQRNTMPILIPQHPYESQGMEDPRIVNIDGTYYLTYTAYDGANALGALATSTDLVKFHKMGIIVPEIDFKRFRDLVECGCVVNPKYFREHQDYAIRGLMRPNLRMWDKNIVFFPDRINGKLAFLHRIRPGIQIVFADEVPATLTHEFWVDYLLCFSDHIVMEPRYAHESSYIGAGCPPIATDRGWLLIYHGVEDSPDGYRYHACAALLDKENPKKELARLSRPLFSPEFEWERVGVVNNVVFPTGTALFGDRLYIYYGAADCRVAVASVNIQQLLAALSAPHASA